MELIDMSYKYLITYYGEPLGIADTEKKAKKIIKNYRRYNNTSKDGYSVDAVRYYKEKKNEEE